MPERFILDANVLYSARLRDLFLQLQRDRVVEVYWTNRIEEEWTAALNRERPDLAGAVDRTAQLMRANFPASHLADGLRVPIAFGLPDPSDEHVALAALPLGAKIVTFSVADFPNEKLVSHCLSAISPDVAFFGLASAESEGVLSAVGAVRSRLRNPPIGALAYAAGLAAAGCPRFGQWLLARISSF